jgi:hypothetical protein
VEEAEATVKRLPHAAGFSSLAKRWDKYINVGGEVEKQMFLAGSNITCFTFHIHL